MATEREDEVEYESDPEEAKQSLAMRRRRAASDDEEGSEKEEAVKGEGVKESRTGRVRSEESDSEGGAADYEEEDEEEEGELEEEEELDGEEEEEDGNYEDAEEVIVEDEVNERRVGEVERNEGVDVGLEENVGLEEKEEAVARDAKGEGQMAVEESLGEWGEDQAGDQVEKKENEPYAVPTAGAFYMHDDRFRDSVGGRNRYCL